MPRRLGGSGRPLWGAVRGPAPHVEGTRGPEAGTRWRREVGRAWPGLAAHTWGASGLSQPSRPRAFPGGRWAGKEIPGFRSSGFFFWRVLGVWWYYSRPREGTRERVATGPSAGRLFLSGVLGLRVRGEVSLPPRPGETWGGGAVTRIVE